MERLNERAQLMGRMIETIGAMKQDRSSAQTDLALRSAAIRCIRCTHTETCRKWLEEHPEGAEKALPECPNASLFNSWIDD
ncbi:hypothetical protein DCO57_15130 [Labrenzia sp. 011]|nr:hypothetical protein DCO57_15130 [Labrenzia sp. 011]